MKSKIRKIHNFQLFKLIITNGRNTLYIYGFSDIVASSNIVILVTLTLPTTVGATTSVSIKSYTNQNSADIVANGCIVDVLSTGLTLTIATQTPLSLDGNDFKDELKIVI